MKTIAIVIDDCKEKFLIKEKTPAEIAILNALVSEVDKVLLRTKDEKLMEQMITSYGEKIEAMELPDVPEEKLIEDTVNAEKDFEAYIILHSSTPFINFELIKKALTIMEAEKLVSIRGINEQLALDNALIIFKKIEKPLQVVDGVIVLPKMYSMNVSLGEGVINAVIDKKVFS